MGVLGFWVTRTSSGTSLRGSLPGSRRAPGGTPTEPRTCGPRTSPGPTRTGSRRPRNRPTSPDQTSYLCPTPLSRPESALDSTLTPTPTPSSEGSMGRPTRSSRPWPWSTLSLPEPRGPTTTSESARLGTLPRFSHPTWSERKKGSRGEAPRHGYSWFAADLLLVTQTPVPP